jgi:ABC-type enterochelin transport system substrate-binding protein
MKWVFIMLVLTGCGLTSNRQKQEQQNEQSVGQDQQQKSSMQHQDARQETSVPVTIICIQNFNGKADVPNSPCFTRQGNTLPGDGLLK